MTRYLSYRTELVIWLGSIILRPIIFLALWTAAARSMGGTLRGWTSSDLASYFILALLVYHLTFAWVMFMWEPRVKNGYLSYLLLRPSHVYHRDFSDNITFKIATFPVIFLTAVVLYFTFHPQMHLHLWQVLAAIPVLILAWSLHFTLSWTLALGAFFTTQVDALNVAFFFALMLLSGQMAPLSLLPSALQTVAMFLPFYWFLGFPIEVIMGRIAPAQVMTGIGMQAMWLSITLLTMWLVWRRGLKSYMAVGI